MNWGNYRKGESGGHLSWLLKAGAVQLLEMRRGLPGAILPAEVWLRRCMLFPPICHSHSIHMEETEQELTGCP